MRHLLAAAALMTPQGLFAQDAPERSIQVTGTAVVRTVPDIALLDIYLRGEGATPDAATTAIAARQKAVTGGMLALLGGDSEIATGNVTVIEARGAGCADARGYGSQPRISTGDCAVTGYIATMQTSIRTRNVDRAGTAIGLASRLGASDARLQGYALSNPEAAQDRAGAAAIEAARRRAMAVAQGAGLRLGPIVSVRDQAIFDGVATGLRVAANAPAAPSPAVSPVAIDVKPRPIETRAQVYVTYAIAPGAGAAVR